MNPKDRVIDLVDRTLANLQALDSAGLADDLPESFEVTQLVNSLMSLLVIPKELKTIDYIVQGTGAHVRATGLPDWRRGPVEFELRGLHAKPPERLGKLLIGLRNSVAHATFDFIPGAAGEISALKFIACGPNGKEFWEATFKIAELRKFLFSLGRELKEARMQQQSRTGAPVLTTVSEPSRTMKVTLPVRVLDQIAILVENGGVGSLEQFVQDAVLAATSETVDVAAA